MRLEPDPSATIRAIGRTVLELTARVRELEQSARSLRVRTELPPVDQFPIIAAVVEQASRECLLSPAEITGPAKDQYANRARQWVMAESYIAGASVLVIARALGERHHSTIRHGIDVEMKRRGAL